MFGYFYIKHFFYGLLNGLNTWIAKFYHFAGISKDHMIVLPVEIRFFILRLVLPKLVLSN